MSTTDARRFGKIGIKTGYQNFQPPTGDEIFANARLIAAAPELLAELEAAHRILNVMLNNMNLSQKTKVAAILEKEGTSPEGMIRAHERNTVIAKATGKDI